MSTIERRIITATSVRAIPRTEFSSSPSPGTLTGYASVYNQPTRIGSDFVERVAPGCFDKAIRDRSDVRALWNHDQNFPLGRVGNSSLRLLSDSIGLRDEVTLPDTSYARDLFLNVRNGTVDGQSFGFIAEDEDWDDDENPEDRTRRIPRRTLRSVKLIDVSFVTFPQYDGTSASARSQARFDMFPDGTPREIRSRFGSDFRARYEARELAAPSRESLEDRIKILRLF